MFKVVPKKNNWKGKVYPTLTSRWIDYETGLRKNFDGTLEKPEFMKIRKGKLTKKEKQVVAKTMYEAGWGSKRLSEWFNMTPTTITKWAKLPTPDSLKEFEQTFKMAMLDYDMEATVGIKKRIMQLVPTEQDLTKLVKVGEFFTGEKERRASHNNTQVNIYGDMMKKYGEIRVVEDQK